MIINIFSKYFNKILNFVYPKFCKSCDVLLDNNFVFCHNCWDSIKPIASLDINISLSKKITVYAASSYSDPLKKLMFEKFYSKNVVFCKNLAFVMYKKTIIKDLQLDYLVPIPLHWSRYAKRGYNQSEVIAKELSKLLNIPVLDILKRNKKTYYQSTLSVKDKYLNLKNAFDIKDKYKNKYLLKDKKILIIDDLFTTGATASNAATVLFKEFPESVDLVVACRIV